MKLVFALGLTTVALALGGCSKDSSSNPATVNRDDLNPPTGLQSLTGNAQLTLTWKAANAEKDFTGYDVFVYEGALTDLVAAGVTPTFPSALPTTGTPAVVDLANASVPRCTTNTKLFEKFGFPASTADCSGEVAAQAQDGSSLMFTGNGATSQLADDTTGGSAATTQPTPGNMVPCGAATLTGTISLAKSTPTLDTESCVVTMAWNTTTNKLEPLVNGKTYTVFVAAVSGSKNENLSWTSNFVEDTPSMPVYDGDALSIDDNGTYFVIPKAKLLAAIATGGKALVPGDINTPNQCTSLPAVCDALQVNPQGTADGLYIGRAGNGNFPERALLSVPAGGAFALQARGAQTASVGSKDGLPGDHALDSTANPYDTAGTTYPILGNQVFDFTLTDSGKTYYGKVVFGTLSMSDPTNEKSTLNMPVRIVMQPTAGIVEYAAHRPLSGH